MVIPVVSAPVPVHTCGVVFQTTTYQESFILGPYVPCRVGFHSMTSDPGSMPGVGLEINHLLQYDIFFVCIASFS